MSTYELVLRARRAEARKIKRQAEAEGRAEGRAEGLMLAAEKLLRQGFTPEIVASSLELDLSKVQSLAQNLARKN